MRFEEGWLDKWFYLIYQRVSTLGKLKGKRLMRDCNIASVKKAVQKGNITSLDVWKRILVTCFMMCMVVIAFAVFSKTNRQRIELQNARYLEDAAGQTAKRIDELFIMEQGSIRSTAYLIGGDMSTPEVDLDKLDVTAAITPFSKMEFVDKNGWVNQKENGSVNVSKNHYFQDGIKGNSGMDVELDTKQGKETQVIFYTPFWYGGEIIGVLTGHYREEQMRETIQSTFFGEESGTLLCMQDGTIISNSSSYQMSDNFLKTIEKSDKIKKKTYEKFVSAFKNQETTIITVGLKGNGGSAVVYISKLPHNTDWMILQVFPASVTRSMIKRANRAGIVLEVVLLGTFVFYLGCLICLEHRQRRMILREKTQEIQYLTWLFNILTENTDDIFVLFSPDTYKTEYISPNLERVLGIKPKEVEKDIRRFDKVTVDGKVTLSKESLSAISEGEILQEDREISHYKTDEKRWFRETLYHVALSDSDRFVMTLSDRTIEQQMNEKLREALDIAKSANKAKSHFLSNVSHDMRTPMNAIVGFTMLLQKEADFPEKVRDYTQKITDSSQHLLRLINDTLDMSKIESGKTALNVTEFSMSELLEELNSIMMSQTNAKEQTFDLNVKGEVPKALMGDKLRVNQILLNLLSNACRYTPRGGRIELLVQNISQKHSRFVSMRFVVTDNGIGMHKEFLEKIFDPFVREISSTTNRVLGTGLGMAITKNLVDVMGGTISVESELGKGSCFTVDLEFASAEVKEEIPEKEPEFENTGKALEGLQILLAEDNELNMEILEEILKMEGASFESTENGKEALDVFEQSEQGHFDVILLDIQMPVMNGYEAAKAIRACKHPDAASIPIIAMTANAFAEDVKNALNAGMNAHIAKPINIKLLIETLEELRNRS